MMQITNQHLSFTVKDMPQLAGQEFFNFLLLSHRPADVDISGVFALNGLDHKYDFNVCYTNDNEPKSNLQWIINMLQAKAVIWLRTKGYVSVGLM